jgi:hypothetical protein
MKKVIYTLIVLVSAGALTGITACKKFLDVEPRYQQDADNYFNSQSDYELALTGAYDLLQGTFVIHWIGEIASDNSIAGGESVTDTEGLHNIDNMTHNAVNNELRNVMRWMYAGITRVNYIMEFKDKTDFTGKERLLGEARFLRAYYYFELVKFFGDVPLVIDKRLGAEEVTKIPRTPAAQVYQQIEADLNYAAANLDWVNPVKGRADKGAALALLGKVQLYQNKFSAAATTFEQVITQGGYSLVQNYESLWTAAGENNSETVFDVEYSSLEGGSYDCLICLEGNAAAGFQGIRQYNGPKYGDGNSYNLPTAALYNSFEPGDPRRDLTVLDLDAFIAAQPNPGSITYAIGGGGHTGYYNNKYIKRQDERGLPDDDLTSPLNYKAIRYADVLLMAAEAHNKSGNDGKALQYLNEVRGRVGMPARSSSGSQLYLDILLERRHELSCEGLRFFDLVRTGQAAQFIPGFVPNKHELFPIPQVEIDLAGGNWKQNPGY